MVANSGKVMRLCNRKSGRRKRKTSRNSGVRIGGGTAAVVLPHVSKVCQEGMEMTPIIAEEKGNYLLVARGDRFAVIERRNNRLYNCHDEERDGISADDLSEIARIVDEEDWVDEASARAALDEAVSRWIDLAEHMR